ncbi:hypothetical protein D1AOALGA4SA_6002 [Olavius algarvensis Delta 1 endosymbiont]|nr:hypothetical protein D1AOALGA4SA_6002 [Olavius algarvensis Delta 1 endosymbiont]
MSRLQELLGFVTLNPTYIFAVLLRNAKPNISRYRNRFSKVSFINQTGCPLAGGSARVQSGKIIVLTSF